MLYHSLDDPTIQFEMARVMSGMCKPTVGATARLMRVMRYFIDRPTVSWMFKLNRHQQKLASLVDADHASDETTRKSVMSHLLGGVFDRDSISSPSNGCVVVR